MEEFITQAQGAAVEFRAANRPQTRSNGEGSDFGTFFENMLDIVNPLQHLPVVSAIYREVTGDRIAGPARLIGGAIYGGALGAASAAINLAVEDLTGSDIGAHALALISGEDTPTDEPQFSSRKAGTRQSAHAGLGFETIGDTNGMTPDAVTWSGVRRSVAAPLEQQAQITPTNAAPVAATPIDAALPNVAPGEVEAVDRKPAEIVADIPVAPADGPIERPAVDTMSTTAVPVRTAWVGAALAEAERQQVATDAGRDTEPTEAPAWLVTAMESALDKYQALAVERNTASPDAAYNSR